MGVLPIEITPDCGCPNLPDARAVLESMDKDRALDCLNELTPHLATFLRAHVMHDKLSGDHDSVSSIEKGIDSAIKLGLPSLWIEASSFATNRGRVGKLLEPVPEGDTDRVYFGSPVLAGKVTITNMAPRDSNWKVVDFGDSVPIVDNDPIWDYYGKSLIGGN